MADRIALAIEPDTHTADQIRRLLEPKGFRVESIPNGDDAMEWGRTNKPAVIILSVEPRKVFITGQVAKPGQVMSSGE